MGFLFSRAGGVGGLPPFARKLPEAAGGGLSAPITDNLKAWYANNVGLTESSSFVSAWADQSGNGYDLTQTSSTRYPENSAGTLTFDGTDDFLESDALALTQPYTVYWYGQQVTWGSNDAIWDTKPAAQGRLRQSGLSPWISLFAGGGSDNFTTWPVATDKPVACLFNGSSSRIVVGTTGAAVNGNAGTQGGTGWTLGALLTQFSAANIQVRELLIYAATHTTAQEDTVLNYLADKFA